jgi:hypothetical protein
MKILVFLILVGCGDHEGRRCLTRDEALSKCQVEHWSNGVDAPTAKLMCEPLYQNEACY